MTHQLETQDLSGMIKEQIIEYMRTQEVDRKINETVNEAVTASVQHAMRAPLHARFKDLLTFDMKEIMLQRMLEENYDKGHEDHKMAYKALQKSILRDESEQFNVNKAEKPKKMKRKQDSPKTPPGSPPPSPPSGPSGVSGTTGASDSAQDPLPPPSSTTTNQGDPSQASHAPGSSKTAASTAYTAWTMTTSRFKPSASSIPEDVFMHEEPTNPEPAWSIPSSSLPVLINNWASVIASSYAPPPENSLLSQTGDIGGFIDWVCKKQGITELTTKHLEGPAYEVVKAFHPNVIHLQFQMEECHKLLTNQVDDGLLRHNVSKPLPLGGSLGQVTIQTEFFFNKDLEYLQFGNKGDRLALSITNIKAAHYPDAGLEQMVPDQMWIEEECMYDISTTYGVSHWWFKRQKFYIDRHSADTNRRAIVMTHMRILSVVSIEVFSIYGYDYMKKIILRRADNQEYTIAENDFKDLYLSDFEDLYLLNLKGHLNHLPPRDKKILFTAVNLWIRNLVIRKRVEDFQLGIESFQTQLNLNKPRWEATGLEFMHDYKILDSPRDALFRDKYGMQMLMHFNEIHKFSNGTLQQIDEALDYRVKKFKVNKNNPGLNTSLHPQSLSPSSDSFFEESDTSFSHLDNSLPEFETFSDHTEETRSGSTTTHANNSLPEYESFLFVIEPDQGRLTSVVISDNSNDPLLELPEFESFHFDLYLSFLRPPPKPPDVEICLNFEPDTPVINNFDELNEDECFDLEGGEIVLSLNVENDDSFTFVIRTYLPYLTYLADSPLLLSTRSEDTIFDPDIST
ncbi:hypothetical protein Tco_1050597 [Tanacetum coccineum]